MKSRLKSKRTIFATMVLRSKHKVLVAARQTVYSLLSRPEAALGLEPGPEWLR
jgi:hypothetical protein